MRMVKALIAGVLIVCTTNAEIYQNYLPTDNFSRVKNKYPNAVFTQLNPAWAQENEALFAIEGAGISGKIVIKLNSFENFYKEMADNYDSLVNVIDNDPLLASDTTSWSKELKNTYDYYVQRSEFYWEKYQAYTKDSMDISWVRWIPATKISVKRFYSKYGKPDGTGFSDEDLTPYKKWNRGITVYCDDKEHVERVDYNFTYDEKKVYLKGMNAQEWCEFNDVEKRLKKRLCIKK